MLSSSKTDLGNTPAFPWVPFNHFFPIELQLPDAIPEEVLVQPRFMVAILVWQSEALVSSSGYVDFALQFTPIVIIPESNQITFIIDHLTWDADLVAVEVVGLLDAFSVFGYPIANLC